MLVVLSKRFLGVILKPFVFETRNVGCVNIAGRDRNVPQKPSQNTNPTNAVLVPFLRQYLEHG